MGFNVTRQFLYALDDKDFLSILDGADFYNKKVTVKRFYYNRIFGTILRFVNVESKKDRQILASIIQKLVIERLTRVNHSSFIRYFSSKIFHSNREVILDRISSLADKLNAEVQKKQDINNPDLVELDKWLNANSRIFRKVIKLFSKKNTRSYSIPDLRGFKSHFRFQYNPERNAFYIDSDQTLAEQQLSYVCAFFEYLLKESNLEDNQLLINHIRKCCRLLKVEIPSDFDFSPFDDIVETISIPLQEEEEETESEEVEIDQTERPPRDFVKGLRDILGDDGFQVFSDLDPELFTDTGFLDSMIEHSNSGISSLSPDQIKAIRTMYEEFNS